VEKRRELGKAARERVSGYTWNHYGDNLVKAYEKITSQQEQKGSRENL